MPAMPTTGDPAPKGRPGRKSPDPAQRRRPLATADEVCAYFQISINTLYDWRKKGIGPKGARVGRELRFDWNDVDAYYAERLAS